MTEREQLAKFLEMEAEVHALESCDGEPVTTQLLRAAALLRESVSAEVVLDWPDANGWYWLVGYTPEPQVVNAYMDHRYGDFMIGVCGLSFRLPRSEYAGEKCRFIPCKFPAAALAALRKELGEKE